MFVIILYVIPILIAILIFIPWIVFILKLCFSSVRLNKDPISVVREEWNRFKKDNISPPLSDLQKTKPFLIYGIWNILGWVSVIYVFPVFILRMILAARFGVHFLWKFPVSLYELWDILFLVLSFYYASINETTFAILIASLTGLTAVYSLGSFFEKEKGHLKLMIIPVHKLNIVEIIQKSVTVVISFAAIYYSINKLTPKSFSSDLNILDSIYFSIMTFATVGYGDIYPISFYAKLLSILEVCFSFGFVVIFMSMVIEVWLNHRLTKENKSQKG